MDSKDIEISNTLLKGRITEIECLTYFLKQGYIISSPEIPCAYDFILDVKKSLLKIQVKTSHLSADGQSIEFNTSSMTHNSNGYIRRQYTENDVDYFATYYNNICYLIPFKICGKKQKKLRLTPTKNGQIKNITFARDYVAEEVLKQYYN